MADLWQNWHMSLTARPCPAFVHRAWQSWAVKALPLARRVPEDCPLGVADLWQACIADDPSVRPSAANVQAALRRLQSVPRPAPAPPVQAVPAPPAAARAGHSAPQAAARGALASCSGAEQAGVVSKGGAGAPGAMVAEQPAHELHAAGCQRDDQAAAVGAAGSAAHVPDSGEQGAAGILTQSGSPKRQQAERAHADSPVSPLDAPHSE